MKKLKKNIQRKFYIVILIFSFLILFLSCGSSKSTLKETKTNDIEVKTEKKDSTSIDKKEKKEEVTNKKKKTVTTTVVYDVTTPINPNTGKREVLSETKTEEVYEENNIKNEESSIKKDSVSNENKIEKDNSTNIKEEKVEKDSPSILVQLDKLIKSIIVLFIVYIIYRIFKYFKNETI